MVDTKKKGPDQRRALGRGLDALLPAATAAAAERVESEFQRVAIERVRPNPAQPRKRFDSDALDELAESIRAQGLIQPLVVRKHEGAFELIAGERRWRAAQRAGLHDVPVVVKDVNTESAFEMALVENLQRTDLDPIETAEAYQRLVGDHGYTVESVASRVGKSRAAVANTMRLLQLPQAVRGMVVAGLLSEGHGRALMGAREEAEITRLANEAVEKHWSVRETEAQARKAPAAAPRAVEPASSGAPSEGAERVEASAPAATRPAESTSDAGEQPEPPAARVTAEVAIAAPAAETPAKTASAAAKNPNARDLEKKLSAALGMAVMIREDSSSKTGVVEIAYDSVEQLDALIEKVLGP